MRTFRLFSILVLSVFCLGACSEDPIYEPEVGEYKEVDILEFYPGEKYASQGPLEDTWIITQSTQAFTTANAAYMRTAIKDAYTRDENRRLRIDFSGMTFTSFPASGFSGCYAVKEVILPTTCVTLSSYSFRYNWNLDYLYAPGVKTLVTYVFEQCYALEELMLPSLVSAASNRNFDECTGLKKLGIGSSSSVVLPIENFQLSTQPEDIDLVLSDYQFERSHTGMWNGIQWKSIDKTTFN